MKHEFTHADLPRVRVATAKQVNALLDHVCWLYSRLYEREGGDAGEFMARMKAHLRGCMERRRGR